MDETIQEIELENFLESVRQAHYRRRIYSLIVDDWKDWMNEELKHENANSYSMEN
jgi:hypothetical protein